MTVSRFVAPKSNQLLIWVEDATGDAKLHEFYEVFSGIGDVQQIDLTYYSMFSVILLTYFDVRIAEHAKTLLEEISSLRVSLHTPCTATTRSIVISDMQLQKIEAGCGVASYGDIEWVKNLNDGRVLVSYYDARAAQKAMVDIDPLRNNIERDEPNLTRRHMEAARNATQTEIGMLLEALENQRGNSSFLDQHDMGGNDSGQLDLPHQDLPETRLSYSSSPAPGLSSLEDARSDAFFEADLPGMSGESCPNLPPGFISSEFEVNPSQIFAGMDSRTTIMARHIPNSLTQQTLVSLLNSEGFKDLFDLVYLPMDKRTKCNVGYAFINMVNPQVVADFYRRFHLKRWSKYNSAKICEVMFARIQGREALKEELHRRQADMRRRPFWEHDCGAPMSGNLQSPLASGLPGSPPVTGSSIPSNGCFRGTRKGLSSNGSTDVSNTGQRGDRLSWDLHSGSIMDLQSSSEGQIGHEVRFASDATVSVSKSTLSRELGSSCEGHTGNFSTEQEWPDAELPKVSVFEDNEVYSQDPFDLSYFFEADDSANSPIRR